jgi:hypothetical protein
MKKTCLLSIFLVLFIFLSNAQTAQQLISVHNYNNLAAINAINNPPRGALAYNLDLNFLYYYNGTTWVQTPSTSTPSSSGWGLMGNSGTNPIDNFIGTSDNQDLIFGTNNTSRLILKTGATADFRLLFPKIVFFPGSGLYDSGVIGIDGNQGRLRITSGDDDTFNNSQGASIDLHGNNTESGFQGRLDLVAGSGASGSEQGINFYTTNTVRATMLGNGNFGINTNNPSSRFHINGSGFRYVDGNQGNGKVLTSDANGNASWQDSPGGGGGGTSGWELNGNAISSGNFIGTTNSLPLVFGINNGDRWRINNIGTLESLDNNGNTHIGFQVGQNFFSSNDTYNTVIGYSAAENNINGDNLVALGAFSLQNNTSGYRNTSIGNSALADNIDGYQNTAVGDNALLQNQSGNSNTAVGALAYQTGTYTNTTALGFNTQVSASNQIRIGANNITSIGGNVSWSVVSDKRFKENVKDDIVGLDFIMGLKAVSYNFNHKKKNRHHGFPDSLMTDKEYQKAYEVVQNGFLAQDVEALADSLNFNFHGIDKPKNEKDIYALRYAEFVVPLIKAMQEQQAMIIEQKETIKRLEKRIEKIEN